MRNASLRFLGFLTLILGLAFVLPQRAAAQDQDDDRDDPPGRVARLSSIRGSVSFNPAGTDDWVEGVLNRPMTTGDKLWADNNARAELNLGAANLRISGNTGFSFLNLTDDTTQIQITEGTLRVRVKRLEENEVFEVDTPNLAFSILRPGTYKINVNQAGDVTAVEVREGQGEVTGGGSAYNVRSGETGVFSGTDQISADVQGGGYEDDDFDRWCADRDRHEDRSVSARYVSDDVIGYDDLDDNGGWRPVPEYGNVWFPHVTVVDWAPYRYGHWAWISPWGWTWVDDAAWGFAPFHYGRWVTVGGVWGWVPAPRRVVGVVYVRPVYSPALVAWVGGPRFSVGVSVGSGPVGWFPLGPREVFVPSYRVSERYVTRVNVSNTTVTNVVVHNYYTNVVVNKNVTVTNVTYANRRSVTATSGAVFTSAQPVGRNIVRVDQREVERATVVATTPAVAPDRRSVLGAGASARVRPPAVVQQRSVVVKTAPPPPPASINRQSEMIRANGGRPITMRETRDTTVQGNQTVRSNVRIAPPAQQVNPQNQRINRPNAAPNQPAQPVAPSNQQNPQNQQNQRNQQNQQDQQNQRGYRDRPPSSRANPAPPPQQNPQLDQRQERQAEQLRQKQDQERQRVEQQQQQQQQKIEQKRADEQKQQQIQQRQQQQLEQLEHKHDQEQQKLQQRQQQERSRQESKPAKQEKQDKKDKDKDKSKDKDKDRPH